MLYRLLGNRVGNQCKIVSDNDKARSPQHYVVTVEPQEFPYHAYEDISFG